MFKVGDKVVIVESKELLKYYGNGKGIVGLEGVIIKYIKDRKNPYTVKLEGNKWEYPEYYSEHELKHVKVAYTRLAEKLYPKGHREGEWWYL